MTDADAIVVDPGVVTSEGALLGPSIEDQTSGAFKLGASTVRVEDSDPMNLALDRSKGYYGSMLIGRAGFLDVNKATKEGWVVPKDRKAAEEQKEELRKQMEDREKSRKNKTKGRETTESLVPSLLSKR